MADDSLDVAVLRQRLLVLLADKADLYPTALEQQFPRILARIVELWGSAELDNYFTDLTTTTRHDRQGFPEAIVLELFRLSNLHSLQGHSVGTASSPWDWATDSDYFRKGM